MLISFDINLTNIIMDSKLNNFFFFFFWNIVNRRSIATRKGVCKDTYTWPSFKITVSNHLQIALRFLWELPHFLYKIISIPLICYFRMSLSSLKTPFQCNFCAISLHILFLYNQHWTTVLYILSMKHPLLMLTHF